VAIVRQVAALRLMSARQIQAVHFAADAPGEESAATRARQRAIARLVRDRLLSPLERRVGGVRAGSTGLVVAAGLLAERVLDEAGPRHRTYEPTARFVDHTLAVSQLIVDLIVAGRRGQLDLLDAQAEPESWRTFAGPGAQRVVRPDAFVALGVGEYELRWFIEVDRATESVPTVLRKCHVYCDYYQSGVEQAGSGVFPRVCWTVPDDRRAERLRRAIADDRYLPDALFVVTQTSETLGVLSEVKV
jgi:Replication-relaxation